MSQTLQTRSTFRWILKGLWPGDVRGRKTITSFLPEVISALLSDHGDILDEVERDPGGTLAHYVNRTALHALVDRLKTYQSIFNGDEAMFLWRLFNFCIWRRSGFVLER